MGTTGREGTKREMWKHKVPGASLDSKAQNDTLGARPPNGILTCQPHFASLEHSPRDEYTRLGGRTLSGRGRGRILGISELVGEECQAPTALGGAHGRRGGPPYFLEDSLIFPGRPVCLLGILAQAPFQTTHQESVEHISGPGCPGGCRAGDLGLLTLASQCWLEEYLEAKTCSAEPSSCPWHASNFTLPGTELREVPMSLYPYLVYPTPQIEQRMNCLIILSCGSEG